MAYYRIQGITASAVAQTVRSTVPLDFGVWQGATPADAQAAFERDAKALRGQHGRSSGPGILWDYMRAGGQFQVVGVGADAPQTFTVGGG